ncbi:YchF family ATPase [bacterium]|jgi:GTP-binding protein YchF|nr:YchF family ATPase [bacterium]
MKLGLVGLPKVGKKTLFELLTGQSPGMDRPLPGLADVRDERFEKLVEMYSPKKRTPAQIDFVMLPDLDTQAERNRELFQHLERVDVICYVARVFKDDTVFHVEGDVSAERDINTFSEELQLGDLIFIEKRLERIEKETGRKIDPAVAEKERDLLTRMKDHLEEGSPLVSFGLEEEDERIIGSYPFLTRKPVVVVMNVGEGELADDPTIAGLTDQYEQKAYRWISISAQVEQEISQLDDEERAAFLDDLGIASPAIDRLTLLCYETLGLISFFTVGEDEVRAWTIRNGSKAPQAGRAIHKDIERGFIRSEVMGYSDLVLLGSEQKVKEAGKLTQKGKDHVVEDGEIHHFLFKV